MQGVLLKVSCQRSWMIVLLSGPLPCLFLCIVVPLGPAVHLHDIFICWTTMTAQPDGIVSAHSALTLSLAILSQKSCQGKCALSSFSHLPISPLNQTTPAFSVRSIFLKVWSIFLGRTFLCSPKPLSFFIMCLLTPNIEVLRLQYNLIFCAYRACLLRLDSHFQSSAEAPDVYLPSRAGLSSAVWYLICCGTLSFVSSNEMERKSVLLTGCRSKGGSSEPMTVDDLCLSAGFQSCYSFVLGWSCLRCCQQEH